LQVRAHARCHSPHQDMKIRDFLLRIFRILLAMNSSFPV
jgi:hypothetical protein